MNRLDLSDQFLEQFINAQNKKLKEQVSLYEIENTGNTNILTIAINPKKYFEKCKDFSINKKNKGLKKYTPGMDFEARKTCYAALILFWKQTNKKWTKKISDNKQFNANEIC